MVTEDTLTNYRVTMIEELGYSREDAEKLADSYYDVTVGKAKDSAVIYKMRTDHHKIRHMLDAGATREQVLAILL